MPVFDVVCTVAPGAIMLGRKPGRWYVASKPDRDAAEELARLCNAAVGIEGIRYTVERHDRRCEGRAPVGGTTPQSAAWALPPCRCEVSPIGDKP